MDGIFDMLNLRSFRQCLNSAVRAPDAKTEIAKCEVRHRWTLMNGQKKALMKINDEYFDEWVDAGFNMCCKDALIRIIQNPGKYPGQHV